MVYRVRFQNRMPLRSSLRSWAVASGPENPRAKNPRATYPSAIEVSHKPRIRASFEVTPWKVSRKRERASFAQEAVDILRLVEILGGVEPDRRDESRRCQIRAKEIGAGNRDARECRAAQLSAPQRGVGQIRTLERCEFQVHP